MQAGQLLATAFAAIGFAAATTASLHALLHKRRPQSAFGWIALCFTLPLAGALLYYLFGINRVQARARKLLTALMFQVYLAGAAHAEEPRALVAGTLVRVTAPGVSKRRLTGALLEANEREIVILATTSAQVNYWARLIQALGCPPAPFIGS